MNKKHQELIEEKVSEFDSLFAAGLIPKHKYDVQGKEIRFFIEKTLQDTIDTVLEGEKKQAALIVEEMMEDEEHWKPITNRILDNTLPNKV